MPKGNPYSLTFGRQPGEIIPRIAQTELVMDAFLADTPSQQVYMVTGIRGSGKTVFMTTIVKKMRENKDWIVVELNPERDLLTSLAAKLSSENALATIFAQAKINLSFFGLGVEIDGAAQIKDIETALSKMLESLKKHNKRLLIAVDEVVSTPEIRAFASAFQIFLRQDLPVYLLMTGLYENIAVLQDEKTLTFLYRAPKIELKPLNIGTIAASYQRVFELKDEDALKMARLTMGYSFAFQVLGYFTWEHRNDTKQIQTAYKQYLDEYVYEKVWSELPQGEQRIMYAIAKTPGGRIKDIRKSFDIETNYFNPYRKKLIRRGLINGDTYGHVFFTLPLFDQFVLENYIAEE